MASASSHTLKYDVFPSFSGEDVRKSFLSHFLEKLQRKSIITFIDHGIERSRPIALELLSAIRESRISIVIFSKKYASSTWCLNELVQIHKCYEELGQMVIPVFYDVDPSDVRKQTGEFGKAFETTCKDKKEDDKKRWKIALAEVAGIAGEDSRNWSDEAKMIEQISNDVSNKLFTPSDDFCDYVGIQAHVDKLTVLDMSGCTSLELSTSIGYLDLSDTAEEVPSWIKNIVWLIELRMRGCEKLKAISANIWNLEHIDYVDFTDCGGVTSISDASLVKTVAELHEEMYLFCSDSYTKFLFHNCFNFDQDAQKFMLQSYSRFTVLPGKEVPTYFRHQTCGSSLIVPLPQSSLSQKDLEFTICIIPEPATDFQHSDSKIIVHWKFRGVKGVHKVKLDMDAAKMDHLVMFHFDICLGEERLDPPSQLDCNNMGFEFAFHYTTGLGNILTFSLLPIIGCGV